MNIKIILILLTCYTVFVNGQIEFKDLRVSPEAQILRSGLIVGFCDLNGDFHDDLLAFDASNTLWIGYGSLQDALVWKKIAKVSINPVWAVNVGDIDKNGWVDIVIATDEEGILVFLQTQNVFQLVKIVDDPFFPQAATLLDLNADGYLDLTICDDNHATRIYTYTPNNIFERNNSLINLNDIPEEFTAGNYGSIWSDVDGDGDRDLYISKCYGLATEPTDLRRINRLYLNTDTGFVESAAKFNLHDGSQSWCSDFGDVDNDGDFDALIVNHASPSFVMENINNTNFLNITQASGFDVNSYPIQGFFEDLDNDMDLDIVIFGTDAQIWENKLGNIFEKTNAIPSNFVSGALGDINNDGFLDLYVNSPHLLNNPSASENVLYLNQTNNNHYIKLKLRGVQSNVQGIGATVYCYAKGITQIREVHGGEAYGVQNSTMIIFGLANNETADSIKIVWPSGEIDRFNAIVSNQSYLITEGSCIAAQQSVMLTGDTKFCEGQVIELNLTGTQVEWSDSTFQNPKPILQSQLIFGKLLDSARCLSLTGTYNFEKNPMEHFKISVSDTLTICQGSAVILHSDQFSILSWSNGDTSKQILVSQPGAYFASAQGLCDTLLSNTVFIDTKQSADPITAPIQISHTQPVVLQTNAKNPKWYNNKDDIEPIYIGNNIVTDSIFASKSFWLDDRVYAYGGILFGAEKEQKGTSKYHLDHLNALTGFRVYKQCVFKSFTVYTDFEGERRFIVRDGFQQVIKDTLVHVNQGGTIIEINLLLEPSLRPYYISTDGDQNNKLFGHNSPKLWRSDEIEGHPYFIGSNIKIEGNDVSNNNFYYFYNWQIGDTLSECVSNRVEQKIELVTSVDNDQIGNLNIFPNPGDERITVSIPQGIGSSILKIYDVHGKILNSIVLEQEITEIQTAGLPVGTYYIQLVGSRKVLSSFWIKK